MTWSPEPAHKHVVLLGLLSSTIWLKQSAPSLPRGQTHIFDLVATHTCVFPSASLPFMKLPRSIGMALQQCGLQSRRLRFRGPLPALLQLAGSSLARPELAQIPVDMCPKLEGIPFGFPKSKVLDTSRLLKFIPSLSNGPPP